MITVLGGDPGNTAGFLLAGWRPGERKAAFARAFQCDGDSAALLLAWICDSEAALTPGITAVQIEAWDSRPLPGGLHGASPSAIQAQISDLEAVLAGRGVPCVIRPVADVKTWAGDERLKRAGLLDTVSPAPMRHAKSAAWHCLYCAVHDCGLPDPLSRRAGVQEARDVPG
jgi:hypothetical protein